MTKITKRLNIALLAGLVASTTVLCIPQAMAEDRGGRKGGQQGPKGDRSAKVFARMDVNEDGVLSLNELTDPTAAKAEKMLTRKDTDENGSLSLEEYQQNRHGNAIDLSAIADEIVQCVTDMKAQSGNESIVVPTADSFMSKEDKFNALDTSTDGAIDLVELQSAGLIKATAAFANMDADADGAVTSDEFNATNQRRRATKKAIRQCVHDINDDNELI
jgi:Ca2+-binding EF-hand superfamily protein